jgi:acetyltransferase-like isoleucine patch superfamily enzyme
MSLLYRIIAGFKVLLIYKWQFRHFGKKSKIISPLRLDGKKNIEIGNSTYIAYNTWLASVGLTGEKEPLLRIGSHCAIGNFNHIYATHEIIIEDYVLTADKVYISDNLHSYENPEIPIIQQPIKQIKEVIIGKGSWIGENVCIIGASIGKNCVIGANAVVTKDIPDYSVAVGNPAKIIKQYNFKTKQWERLNIHDEISIK